MIYIILVGRILGPADYADFSAALSLIYFCAVALTPITPTLARIVAALTARGSLPAIVGLRNEVMLRMVAFCAGTAVVALAVSPLLARWLRFRSALTPSLALSAALVFALLSVDRGVLQGLMQFRRYNASILVESSVRCLGAVLLLDLAYRSAELALVSYVVAVAVAELIIAHTFSREWRTSSRQPADWNQIRRLAVPMFGLMLSLAVFQNVDMFVVKRWFDPTQTGVYGAATALARSFGILFVPLYVLAGPTLTRLHESGQRLWPAALRLSAWYLALSAAPMFIFATWPEKIVGLLYGPAFIAAASLIVPLGGVAIITYCALMLAQVLITIHDFRFLRVYAVMAVAQIAGLAMFHGSFGEVLTVLYVCQSAVLVALTSMLLIRRSI